MRRAIQFIGAGSLLAATALAWPLSSSANPFFARQTGQPCATCHMQGQENAGRAGLNPTGQSFLACGEQTSCLNVGYPQPPQPQYGQQPYQPYQQQSQPYQQPYQPYQQPYQPYQKPTSAMRGGMATFKNDCGLRTRYIVVREGNGTTANYHVNAFGSIQVPVTQNATFAASCGNQPGFAANFRPIALDQ